MASLQDAIPPVFQKFTSKTGTPLVSLPTHVCLETNQRYVLCSDVQDTFEGISCLLDQSENIILFMIDNNGELHHPFRILYNPETTFKVVCHDSGDPQIQGNNIDILSEGWHMSLTSRGTICKSLYGRLESHIKGERHAFQKIAANARHHHSTFVQHMDRQDRAGTRSEVDRIAHGQILQDLQDYEQQLPEWERRNDCLSLFYEVEHSWDQPVSTLFIVLPSDLDSWDDNDSSTHHFRICFLCNVWVYYTADKKTSHPHFSNHPGFRLNRAKEFLQTYGNHALRVLQMIKRFEDHNKSLSLYTFQTLRGCDPNITVGQLSRDSIVFLIEKAITYLLDLSPPKQLNVRIGRHKIAAIKSYLVVPKDVGAEGELYRSIKSNGLVNWFCKEHLPQKWNSESLEELKDHVGVHGGHINMQQATLRVELGSETEVIQFLSLLKRTGYRFDISIKLKWNASRSVMETIYREITQTPTLVLEIDGVTLDAHPQNLLQYTRNLFTECHFDGGYIDFVTLRNYPRPQEQFIYAKNCSLRSSMLSVPLSYNWVGLRNDLNHFRGAVSERQDEADYEEPLRKLRSELAMHGLTAVTEVTIYHKSWNGTFDLLEGALVEVYSSDLEEPKALASLRSLRRMTHITDKQMDPDLYRMVQANTWLQDLNISSGGWDVLWQVEPIVRLCHHQPKPFTFTLFNRYMGDRCRVVVQVEINRFINDRTERSVAEVQEVRGQAPRIPSQAQDAYMHLEVLEWDCDHLFFHFPDFYASFFDMATKHSPAVLTSLTLDISALSETGLACIQQIFARSDLEYLCFMCTSFETVLSRVVAQVLESVQWGALKYLVLSGENIDGWLKIWNFHGEPRLLRLDIHGSGSVPRELLHSSVLYVHRLIHASPLVELHLGNIYLKESNDWVLIVDGLDSLLLETFGLCEATFNQFMSTTDAVGLFLSKFQIRDQEGVNATIALSSFTLDIGSPSQDDYMRLQNIFRLSFFQHLRINCASSGQCLLDDFAQVIGSVPWPTLTSLVLSGDDIDVWIRLLNAAIVPQLQRLVIQGTGSDTQQLSHESALIVQRLIQTCLLEELRFENVRLQEPNDWVPILETILETVFEHTGSWRRKKVEFCEIAKSQFSSVRSAATLFNYEFQKFGENRSGYVPLDSEVLDIEARVAHTEDPPSEEMTSTVAEFVHRAREKFRSIRRKLAFKAMNQTTK